MLNYKKLLTTSVAVAALGVSGVASAHHMSAPTSAYTDSALYFGIGLGVGDTHWDSITADPSDSGFTDASDIRFAGRAFLGYSFNENFAVEGGYAYFSDTKFTPSTVKVKTYAIDLAVKLSQPITEGAGVYGKVGLGYLHSKYKPAMTGGISSLNDLDVTFGAGFTADLGENFVADLSWQRYGGNFSNAANRYHPHADLYTVGLAFVFGA